MSRIYCPKCKSYNIILNRGLSPGGIRYTMECYSKNKCNLVLLVHVYSTDDLQEELNRKLKDDPRS